MSSFQRMQHYLCGGYSNRGFSIVELVVVIAIISTLLGIVSINFHSWQRKSQIDRQTRELHTDINTARLTAVHTKRRQSIVLNPNSYTLKNYSSEGEDILAGTVLQTRQVSYQMTRGLSTAFSNSHYEFDTRGFVTRTNSGGITSGSFGVTIVVNPVDSGGNDCIVLSEGRTNMGKMSSGTCAY